MTYRIELTNGKRGYDYSEFAYGVEEVKTFINDMSIIVPAGYKVERIVKTTKDGRGYDVTNKYM